MLASTQNRHSPFALNGTLAPLTNNAETRDRTGDLQIFSLTLSQLSYRGLETRPRNRCDSYDTPNKDMTLDLSTREIFLGTSPSFFFVVPQPGPDRTERKARPQPARKQKLHPWFLLFRGRQGGGGVLARAPSPFMLVYGAAANVTAACYIVEPLPALKTLSLLTKDHAAMPRPGIESGTFRSSV